MIIALVATIARTIKINASLSGFGGVRDGELDAPTALNPPAAIMTTNWSGGTPHKITVDHDGQRVESKQNLVPLKKGRELQVLRLTKKQLGREGHEGHGPV